MQPEKTSTPTQLSVSPSDQLPLKEEPLGAMHHTPTHPASLSPPPCKVNRCSMGLFKGAKETATTYYKSCCCFVIVIFCRGPIHLAPSVSPRSTMPPSPALPRRPPSPPPPCLPSHLLSTILTPPPPAFPSPRCPHPPSRRPARTPTPSSPLPISPRTPPRRPPRPCTPSPSPPCPRRPAPIARVSPTSLWPLPPPPPPPPHLIPPPAPIPSCASPSTTWPSRTCAPRSSLWRGACKEEGLPTVSDLFSMHSEYRCMPLRSREGSGGVLLKECLRAKLRTPWGSNPDSFSFRDSVMVFNLPSVALSYVSRVCV